MTINLVERLNTSINSFDFVWGNADPLKEYQLKWFEGKFDEHNYKDKYYHFNFFDNSKRVVMSRILNLRPFKIMIPIKIIPYEKIDKFLRKAQRDFHYLILKKLKMDELDFY